MVTGFGTPRKREGAIVLKVSSMVRLAIAYFGLHFSLQNEECVHVARAHVERIRNRKPPARNKFFNPRKALTRDKRFRAFFSPRPFPPPHHHRLPALFFGNEST